MAEKDKPEPGDSEEAKPPAKSSQSLWPLMVGLLVGVPLVCYLMINFLVLPKLIAAVGAPATTSSPTSSPTSTPANTAGKSGVANKEQTVDFGKIMVNVAGSGDARYLRVNLVLASNNPEIKEIIKSNDVALRDSIITVLSSQSLANLEASDGRDAARRALLARINGILGGEVVSRIYFTEFVIQ
jgi:flagellar basal body-associated protein FliL